MPDTDVKTSSGVINPDSINPFSVDQTSTLETVDGDDVSRDGFELSINLTDSEVAEKINIAIVIDQSGSTRNSSGTDFNGDGSDDSILVAEIYAAQDLFDAYIAAGYDAEDVTISLITYENGSEVRGTFTLEDSVEFQAALTEIANEGPQGATNYVAGLDAVGDAWSDSGAEPTDTNVVVFMSDGYPYPGGQDISGAAGDLADDWQAAISGIGLGVNSSLTALNQLDNTPGGASQVLSGDELLDIVVQPLSDADFLRFEIVIDGFDANGDPIQQIIILEEDNPAVTTTQFGRVVNGFELDPRFVPGTDVTVAVTSVFAPDPANPSSGDQTLTTAHEVTVVVCFTPGGTVDIETLVVGDQVVTRDHGVQCIRWIGATIVGAERIAANPHLRSILFRQGALGKNLPETDLRVSRQHRILVRDWRAEVMFGTEGGVLVPAFTLCNDHSIMAEDQTAPVTYIHIAFDDHEVIYAEGVETESFQAAERTVRSMNSAQRSELMELFPELADGDEATIVSARKQPVAREARILAPR
ncbi:MAG: hypothetical protein ACI92Z_002679 [Paracoccaceae bacterium]|jgi:hypothetical protein